jgi:hypothetical protein
MLGQLLRSLTQPDNLAVKPWCGGGREVGELWDSRAPASLNFMLLTPGDREAGGQPQG